MSSHTHILFSAIAFGLGTINAFQSGHTQTLAHTGGSKRTAQFQVKPTSSSLFLSSVAVEDEVVVAASSTTENNPISSTSTASDKQTKSYSWQKQWYPVLPTSFLDEQNLENEPYQMKICGEDLVIWKSSDGEYSILQDTCPHRRALLSTGKVITCNKPNAGAASNESSGDKKVLACRYHGWEFDKDGVCTSIPMIPETKGGFLSSKAFNVPKYHCQTKAGLLWVYMDPEEEGTPIPVSEEVSKLFKEDDDVMITVVKNPISWQTMTENFFDPSHAPFTHEGPQFSPDRAIPMTKYDLNGPISGYGFSLTHSAYQLPPKSKKETDDASRNAESSESKRWFVAPVTCHAESVNPRLNSTIFFVPTQAGETMTLAVFPKFQLPSFIPEMVMDLAQFFFMRNGLYKFLSQDRIIMQSQDQRKVHGNAKGSWEDLYPAVADKGVRAFQTWGRKFAGRPEFTMPSPLDKIEGRQYSFWESTAKYNGSCIRTIKRLSWIAKQSKILSTFTFLGSVGTALAAMLSKQKELVLMKSALALLLSSVASRFLANFSLRTVDSVFANPDNIAKYKTMQIYAQSQ
ncbi:hypothetical protein ACHAWC_008798 [Mediolabrus comicus]